MAILAMVVNFLTTFRQPKAYQVHTNLMIGWVINDPHLNSKEFYIAQHLAGTYVNISDQE
jgi:hypothetical protein